MNTQTDTPSEIKSGKFSLQESFKVLLDCQNRDELKKTVKDHIYPAFEDDFRHFVIEISATHPPPLLGCDGFSSRDQEVIRTYLEEDPLAKLLVLHNDVSEQVFLRDETKRKRFYRSWRSKLKP